MKLPPFAGRWIGEAAPNVRGMAWLALSGVVFAVLNMLMRRLSIEFDPYLTQFWRNFFAMLIMLALLFRHGPVLPRSANFPLQVLRNVVHTLGLTVWFTALAHIPLAEMTAIAFTAPLFVTVGAALFLRETVRLRRWLAVAVGFSGVLVVLRPGGQSVDLHMLVMLASAPLMATSFLLAKVLTRHDSPATIVLWQNVLVTLMSLPLALWVWQWPDAAQFGWLALCGALGAIGHTSMMQGFKVAEISAIQPINFLTLIWSAALGYLAFADVPALTTWIGAAIILAAATYIARREALAARRAGTKA
ncbi:MAG: DMT family transporter [Reyranellaceae bacterium]